MRDQELAVLAAMSGVKYAQMRIEQFQNDTFGNSWGGHNGTNYIFSSISIPTGVDNGFETGTLKETPGTGVVSGTLKGGRASFKMAFVASATTETNGGIPASYNNLWNPASKPRGSNLRNVPQRSVHLIVVGTAGGVSRTVEVILKKQALTDSSAFAGNNLTVNISGIAADSLWYINSVDPFDNSVRANGAITAPTLGASSINSSMATGTFSPSYTPGFTFTGGNKGNMGTLDPKQASLGAIVSKTTISFNGTFVGEGGLTNNDDNETTFAKQQTGGVLYPNKESQSPPELNASDVIPASSKCVYALNPGTYVVDTENHISSVASGSNCSSLSGGCTNTIQVSLVSGPSCATTASLPIKDYMLRIPRNINVQVSDGDFNLQLAPSVTQSVTTQRAKLALGYNSYGYQGTSPSDAPTLHVKRGNVTVSGELTGEGGIVAEEGGVSGKGEITLEGRSVLSTDPSSGVAIYADSNVNINPITSTNAASGNTAFIACKQAINAIDPYSYLSQWGNKDDTTRSSWSSLLGDKVIGTATYSSGTLTVAIPTSTTTSTTTDIAISSSSIYKGLDTTQSQITTTFDATVREITLNQYVRAKYKESHPTSSILNNYDTAFGTGYTNATIAENYIKPAVDNFWQDKENIESQVAQKLEALTGDSKVSNSTGINASVYGGNYAYFGCSIGSNCDTYEEVKNKDILVSFKDYWEGYASQKFSNSNQGAAYTNNFNSYWSQSRMTAAQPLTSQDAEFTGVIYTKGNLTAAMGNHKFFIEGAIISLNGDVNIQNAKKVQFLYNPEYLTKFMNQTGSSVKTRLVQVFWVMW